jgi:hypothetical protein
MQARYFGSSRLLQPTRTSNPNLAPYDCATRSHRTRHCSSICAACVTLATPTMAQLHIPFQQRREGRGRARSWPTGIRHPSQRHEWPQARHAKYKSVGKLLGDRLLTDLPMSTALLPSFDGVAPLHRQGRHPDARWQRLASLVAHGVEILLLGRDPAGWLSPRAGEQLIVMGFLVPLSIAAALLPLSCRYSYPISSTS